MHDAPDVAVTPPILRIIPNPALNAAVIEFTQPEAGSVSIEFLNMMGRRVASDDIGVWSAGRHTHAFDLTGLAPGFYIVVLRSGSQTSRTRLVVLH